MIDFQVHPHFGYLNSDVRLINKTNSTISVKDTLHDLSYEIPASSNISVRLPAGEHRFVINDNESVAETVIVEDAIKLGGSDIKHTYVFDNTPWSLMVMLDRTYFFNRDTGEEYVEHGLVPQKVKYLTNDYLLFVSDDDNSLFSLDSLSVTRTIGKSSFIYSNNHYAVFDLNKELALFSLDKPSEDIMETFQYVDYLIDKEEQKLYFSPKGSSVVVKSLTAIEDSRKAILLEGKFRCFVGSHSVLYGDNTQKLKLCSLVSSNSIVFYDEQIPVSSVNGRVIWENASQELFKNLEIKNAFTSSVELNVFERGEKWFYTKKTKHLMRSDGKTSSIIKFSLHLVGDDNVYLESDKEFTISRGKYFDCVSTNDEKGIIVFPEKVEEYEGIPIVAPDGYILIYTTSSASSEQFYDPLNTDLTEAVANRTLFKKTGLVQTVNNTGVMMDSVPKVLYDISRQKFFYNTRHEELPISGFYHLLGGDGNSIHSKTGEYAPMPCTTDRLLAITEKCQFALVRDEKGLSFLENDVITKHWREISQVTIKIDESFYSKAIFCYDGNYVIYQKKDKEYYLREIGSDIETKFSLQGSVVKRNINGYIPYLDSDTRRRPVYVDPVTLTRIEPEAAKLFTFQSVDGQLRHIKHNVVKYYHLNNDEYVSDEFYRQCADKLDYITNENGFVRTKNDSLIESIKKNRKDFYESNKEWLDKAMDERRHHFRFIYRPTLEEFLKYDSVCDSLIFRTDFFIREEYNGEIIDIKLPRALSFLNYVSYSYDNRYIIVSGRFPFNSGYKGLALVYDVQGREVIYQSTSTMAVWLGVFSKDGKAAYYDSTPNSFMAKRMEGKDPFKMIGGRSFLTFSPSGKYAALSRQGYIPYVTGEIHWGHQPSRDVYLIDCESPDNELAHYRDHGTQIEGTGGWDRTNSSVASATFSADEKKLMTVSKDGVIVIRNLHLN